MEWIHFVISLVIYLKLATLLYVGLKHLSALQGGTRKGSTRKSARDRRTKQENEN